MKKLFTTLASLAMGFALQAQETTEYTIMTVQPKNGGAAQQYVVTDVEEISFKTITQTAGQDKVGAHKYVDLGLSVMWAECNVGASKPEEYGEYISWGETVGKETYFKKDYKYYDSRTDEFTTYTNQWDRMNAEDDAAIVRWGDDWRTPTAAELIELQENCYFEKIWKDGIVGYKVTSRINDKQIFMPCGGQKGENWILDEVERGYYMSNQLGNAADKMTAFTLNASFYSIADMKYDNAREYGVLVRPVKAVKIAVNIKVGNPEQGSVIGNGTYDSNEEITLTAQPAAGYVFVKWSDGNTEKTRTVKASEATRLTPIFKIENFEPAIVDLGLSALWANCNLGADAEQEYGDYYSWGSTTTQESYDDANYPLKGEGFSMAKYNNIDGKKTLELTDDAARELWKGKWQIPSTELWQELFDNCDAIKAEKNGVKGIIMISRINGNSVFFPYGGHKDGTSVMFNELDGQYWASDKAAADSYAKAVWVSDRNSYDESRRNGLTIRPVIIKEVNVTVAPDNNSFDPASHAPYGEVTVSKNKALATEQVTISTTANTGYKFVKWSDGNTDNPRTLSAFKTIGLTACIRPTAPSIQFVDMGTSVKWATFNVGAYSEYEMGDYIAWGETTPSIEYSWYNYKWNDFDYGVTKYGLGDGKNRLEAEDDAAAQWAPGSHTPTLAEWVELYGACTVIETERNDLRGYELTSKTTGKKLFFPIGGYIDNNNVDGINDAKYWTSERTELEAGGEKMESIRATFIEINTYSLYSSEYASKYQGMLIRAVKP